MEGIALVFIKAIVTALGSALGKSLFDMIIPKFKASGTKDLLQQLQTRPTEADIYEAGKQLAIEMQRDPVLDSQIRAEVRKLPPFQEELRKWYGLSLEQAIARLGTCPVGGEKVVFPEYFDNGKQLSRFAMFSLGSMPRSAIARCSNGHTWPVFEP